VEYEKLALRLRRGSSQWESTLFPMVDNSTENRRATFQDMMRGTRRANTTARYSPTFTKGDTPVQQSETSGKNEPVDTSLAFEDGISLMSSLPNADHQLVSTILTSGVSFFWSFLLVLFSFFIQIVLVGLATYDCELFVALPPTVSCCLLLFPFLTVLCSMTACRPASKPIA
jgi:hypothetical protein